MLKKTAIGIDISKAKYDVYVTDGVKSWRNEFPNTAGGHRKLVKWLQKIDAAAGHVCLEATGRYGEEVARCLHGAGYTVSIVNPRIIKRYAQVQGLRNKTDQLDAKLLATYCQREQPRSWQPPTPQQRKLQALTRYLDDLKENRTSQINRLKAGTHPDEVATSLRTVIELLSEQIKTVGEQISDHINQHPELQRDRDLLVSIDGIGETTAAIVLAELPHIANFSNAKQLAAYAGLTPQQLQSGQSHYHAGLLKLGSKHLRTALFFPAISAIRHNKPLAAFARRLAERGKRKMSIVVAVMRKLLHYIFAILTKQQPFDPDYLSNQPIAT